LIGLTIYDLTSTTCIFRNEIDCAIGRQKRNEHFNEIENYDKKFFHGISGNAWECGDEINDLWRDLIEVEYSENCSLKDALLALVKIEKVGKFRKLIVFKKHKSSILN